MNLTESPVIPLGRDSNMNINNNIRIDLIRGDYNREDAMELITQLFQVKIKFHEKKIRHSEQTEEDIKMRERRISELQKDLIYIRDAIMNGADITGLLCSIRL
jgi:cob(I)alamin adenosyltransferase